MNNNISIRPCGRRYQFFFKSTKGDSYNLMGVYKSLDKYKKHVYGLDGSIKTLNTVIIKANKTDNRGNQEKEFDLDKGLHQSIGEWIRTPGKVIGYSAEAIDEAYYQFEEHIIKNEKEKVSHVVPAYGIISEKGYLFTPDKFTVEGINLNDNDELKSFYSIFKNKEIDEDKLKQTVKVLYNYLKNDETNMFVFSYGFISLFRHYLFSKYGLEDFPYIGLISTQTSKGKSGRIRILINGAFLNWTSKSFHTASVLSGSDERFHELNKIMAAIGIEEIEQISNDKVSLLKQLATSESVQTGIANVGGQGMYKRNFIRGAIAFTINEMKEIPSTLKERIILKDLTEHISYSGCDEDYNYLKRNVGIISKYIWKNIEEYKDCLKMESETRKESYMNVFKNGMRLVNKFFYDFGYEPLYFNIKKFIDSQEESVMTEKIRRRKEIIGFVKKFTTYVDKDGYTKKNIFDIQSLMRNSKNKNIYNKIITDAYDNGIVAGEEGILITKTFLEKMRDETDSFFNVKKIYNLEQYFNKDAIRIYRSGKGNNNLNYYDDYFVSPEIPKGINKTGIMLLGVWKDEDNIQWE
jgi:hypothetical protein